MSKVMKLSYLTEGGNTATISIPNPREDIKGSIIRVFMEQIRNADVFETSSGKLAAVKEAKIVETVTTDIDLDEV